MSFSLVALLLFFSKHSGAQVNNDLSAIFRKDEITVVITDSGLGGLSVMDQLARKTKASGCFKKINLIFANALFDANLGYNSIKTREEKINILNSVLKGIEEKYKPDVVLIACNTLSVIYKETDFIKKSKIPVIGIIEPGIKLIKDVLDKDSNSRVIIFGTETTIEEGSHKKELINLNIQEDRIITKECPQLQSYIEQNPTGEETEMLISVYVNEALEKIPETRDKIYLSLNCSHFGYSAVLWEKAISATRYSLGGILDPNFMMAEILSKDECKNRFTNTRISFQVVSKVELLNKKSIYNILREESPELADALQNYQIVPDLFK